MSWKVVPLIILALALAITAASAACIGDKIVNFTSSKEWVVANTVDTSVLTAYITNSSGSCSVPDTTLVTFSVVDPVYGTLTPLQQNTDLDGKASATFKASSKSGSVNITATIPAMQYTYTQKIDHDTPYTTVWDYDGEVIVNTTTPITIDIKDKWGNPVDDRNIRENISLVVGSPLGGAGFYNGIGYPASITLPVNGAGTVSVICKVDTVSGDNIIYMGTLGSIPSAERYRTIVGVSEGIPYSMTGDITPQPYVYANGIDKFYLQYILYDSFGNPAGNRTIWVNSSIGESELLRSNSLGQILATYGPKDTAGTYTLSAIAVDNSSLIVYLNAEFVNTEPTNMLVAANPETMASWDVPGAEAGSIIGKVMDIKGNGVPNETVVFTISSSTSVTPLTSLPSFSSTSYQTSATAITDADGNAIVPFYPGAFPTSGVDYNETASGTATILAQWGSSTGSVIVTFKNYPYLRVRTSVSPAVVTPNETFDVHIELIGDGWALRPKPIDAILCTDRSGSMMYDNPDRMVEVMNAENEFVGSMSFIRDYIGLVSFGQKGLAEAVSYKNWGVPYLGPGTDTTTTDDAAYIAANYPGGISDSPGKHTYSDYATLDSGLTNSPTTISDTINRIIPYSGTPMRQGLFTAINEMIAHGRSNSVKAIILLSDGDYNYYGDPLARGTGSTNTATSYGDLTQNYYQYAGLGTGTTSNQNMSNYAKNNGITIYSIAYGSDISSGGRETLEILAEGTGGKYFWASSTDIADVYTEIAGALRTEASVDTSMELSFQNINITYNNETTTTDGKTLLTYVYEKPVSTWVNSYNKTASPLPEPVLIPSSYADVEPLIGNYSSYPYSFNQTNEWNSDTKLSFNAGNISINQTWETKFRFRVAENVNGTIDIFGPGSIISMNGGSSTLTLPHTFITVVPNLTNTATVSASLDVSNLRCTKAGVITDFMPLEWNIAYTGDSMVTERVSYSSDGGNTWTLFDTNFVTKAAVVDYSNLDVRSLPAGGYLIRVDASAPDAPNDRETLLAPVTVGAQGKAYIKLE
ncbi:MAG: Bacterial Ig-like domain (group 1) [Methanoregula sp. PtaU1.Bin051]|nr:MAG: Bacterial Ig-like domain (group 1) [Methanoregula sp. PtaU1.Bin051]